MELVSTSHPSHTHARTHARMHAHTHARGGIESESKRERERESERVNTDIVILPEAVLEVPMVFLAREA